MTLSELDGGSKEADKGALKGPNSDSDASMFFDDTSANGLFETSGNTSMLDEIYGVRGSLISREFRLLIRNIRRTNLHDIHTTQCSHRLPLHFLPLVPRPCPQLNRSSQPSSAFKSVPLLHQILAFVNPRPPSQAMYRVKRSCLTTATTSQIPLLSADQHRECLKVRLLPHQQNPPNPMVESARSPPQRICTAGRW